MENVELNYRIYDVAGRIVSHNSPVKVQGNNDKRIDISGLENGVYFLELMTDENPSTEKFIKR